MEWQRPLLDSVHKLEKDPGVIPRLDVFLERIPMDIRKLGSTHVAMEELGRVYIDQCAIKMVNFNVKLQHTSRYTNVGWLVFGRLIRNKVQSIFKQL